MVRTVHSGLLLGVLIAFFSTIVAPIAPFSVWRANGSSFRSVAAPSDPALVLVERHDCWTGPAPADMEGELPGHVVVVRDGVSVYGGAFLTGQALEQVFNGTDHGLRVVGFCR